MKILVTGGAGFIGSWVAEGFINLGHNVVIVDNLSSGLESNIPRGAKFYPMDINAPEIERVFAEEKFDIVDHHAAQVDLLKSIDNPEKDIESNLLGTLRLLEHSVKYGVKKFIFASSGGAIYNEILGLPSTEELEYFPPSPYGINKLAAEKYIQYFHRMHGLGYIVLRYSNVYGPRQGLSAESGVVSIFTQRMLSNQAISIYGDGNQTRDFLYVEDAVRANTMALNSEIVGVFNISTNKQTSIKELFSYLKALTGYSGFPEYTEGRVGEVKHSWLSNEKAKQVLNFEPIFDLKTGLKRTIEYYRSRVSSAKNR